MSVANQQPDRLPDSKQDTERDRSACDVLHDLERIAKRLSDTQQEQGDSTSLAKQLDRIRTTTTDRNRLFKLIAKLVLAHTGCRLVVLCRWEANATSSPDGNGSNHPSLFRLAGHALGSEAAMQRELISAAIATVTNRATSKDDSSKSQILASQIPNSAFEVLLVQSEADVDSVKAQAVLHAAASQVAMWDGARQLRDSTEQLSTLAAVTDLVARLEAKAEPDQAARVLVDQIASRHKGVRAVFVSPRGARSEMRVSAISGQISLDRHSEQKRLIEAAAQECLIRGSIGNWPCESNDRHSLLAHRQVADRLQWTKLTTIPIRDSEGKVQGVIVLHGESTSGLADATKLIELAATPLGSAFALLHKTRTGFIQRSIDQLTSLWRTSKGRVVLLCGLLMAGVLAIPVPYRVRADLELQPVTRRYVTAPFDAPLLLANVDTGDHVGQEQLLAELDGRELRWELGGLTAELHQASKELAGYVAAHETGEAEIARLEVERLQQRMLLVEDRIENLEIRSPIEGIVVAGDLRKRQGMPLEVGTTLFEVAPLDSMVVEVLIPEEDVRHVHVGTEIWLALDAFPNQRWEATLAKLHPRAEVIEDQNVFVGEVVLPNPDRTLRPGMRGRAKLAGGVHPLGWNLFHKGAHSLVEWCGW